MLLSHQCSGIGLRQAGFQVSGPSDDDSSEFVANFDDLTRADGLPAGQACRDYACAVSDSNPRARAVYYAVSHVAEHDGHFTLVTSYG